MDEKIEIDKYIYNEKSLYLLNIKELRALGRKLGVCSPASKKKQELVSSILDIVYGKVTISVRNLYGRPSTQEFSMEKYLDKINKNIDISDKLKMTSFNDDISYKKVSEKEKKYITFDNIETRIYVQDDEKHYLKVHSFSESNKDIIISKELVDKYNLENYDVIEIALCDDIYKIISINGIKVKKNKEKILINEKKINFGECQNFYLSTKEEIINDVKLIIKSCENNNFKVVILSENDYKDTNAVVIDLSHNNTKSQIFKKVMMFMCFCEKMICDGEELIVIIEDFSFVNESLKKFENDVSIRIKKNIENIMLKITALGNSIILFNLEEDFKF